MKLMKYSRAIIQPSLFEGWSTVVEDAKSLNAFIILSNLDVHLEQIDRNCIFFSPNDHLELADNMQKVLVEKPLIHQIDYDDNIAQFGQSFIQLINKVTSSPSENIKSD